MLVTKSMTKKVLTVKKDAGLFEIRNLMKENNIRHLPVVDGENRLIGIVTDRDLRSAMPYRICREPTTASEESERISKKKVADIMTPDPISIPARYTIQDALLLIDAHRVGAFPVTEEDGTLVGIVSVRDLIRAFINVLGIGQPGTLLGIVVEDKVGQLKRIVDAITEENISLGSILVARYWDEHKRAVFPYLLTNNVRRIKKKLEELGFQLLDPMDWYFDRVKK
ncbi:Inosine-5'-monophosphate dehydrogenase (EC [Olavius algarvensis associated proteobacterium Delta 3]|nr:Inosine-5'-monophosphate dehydrogenase (EC [Olavius algarvensis associated proteobacterium Delta 3]